ncbi:hypothetical protein [Leeia oryzae]|uniref:hypothetical protein n=1 Tax=Leeia oryzae TaxID=356662 RepID=UPI0003A00867|nr:hypothetical protein [Leeia oryzae]
MYHTKKFKKPVLLIVGAGDIAKRAMPWLRERFTVHVLLRNPAAFAAWRTLGATPLPGDLDDIRVSSRSLQGYRYILHLAPPANEGEDDLRTAHLIARLRRSARKPPLYGRATSSKFNILPQHLTYISTSGVYGNCLGEVVAEYRPVRPGTARAKRRVSAEGRLRQWGIHPLHRLSILRVPGIYAADRLPDARIRAGLPALKAEEDSYTNHIHADDLASIVGLALFRGRPQRVYHAVDDSQQTMGDYFEQVAGYLGLPAPARVSREEARQVLSPSMMSFLNESRRLINTRLKQELRVRLRYPDVASALPAKADRA